MQQQKPFSPLVPLSLSFSVHGAEPTLGFYTNHKSCVGFGMKQVFSMFPKLISLGASPDFWRPWAKDDPTPFYHSLSRDKPHLRWVKVFFALRRMLHHVTLDDGPTEGCLHGGMWEGDACSEEDLPICLPGAGLAISWRGYLGLHQCKS